jgi:hypothetical protein
MPSNPASLCSCSINLSKHLYPLYYKQLHCLSSTTSIQLPSTRVSIKSSLLLSICLIQHNTTCTIKHLHKTLPTLLTPNKTQKCATTPPPLPPQPSVPSSPVALNSLVRVAENTFSSILTISTGTVVLAGVLCSLLCRGEWQRGKL